jgi:hypothetical protein
VARRAGRRALRALAFAAAARALRTRLARPTSLDAAAGLSSLTDSAILVDAGHGYLPKRVRAGSPYFAAGSMAALNRFTAEVPTWTWNCAKSAMLWSGES